MYFMDSNSISSDNGILRGVQDDILDGIGGEAVAGVEFSDGAAFDEGIRIAKADDRAILPALLPRFGEEGAVVDELDDGGAEAAGETAVLDGDEAAAKAELLGDAGLIERLGEAHVDDGGGNPVRGERARGGLGDGNHGAEGQEGKTNCRVYLPRPLLTKEGERLGCTG